MTVGGLHLTKRTIRRVVPQRTRRVVWSSVVDRPMLSRAYYFLDPDMRPLRVTRRTELLIDGFVRSANTYALFAFRLANGPDIRLSHHLHRPLAFRRAVALGVPALLTIRRPADVLASWMQFEPDTGVDAALRTYIWFYEQIEPVLGEVVVADFAEVTADFGAVVRRVNRRFGTSFAAYTKTTAYEAAVFAEVEQFSARHFGQQGFETKVSRPSSERLGADEFVARLTPAQHELLRRANATYGRFVRSAGP